MPRTTAQDVILEILRNADGEWTGKSEVALNPWITLTEVEVGEIRLNMMRAFNAREGIDRKDDALPKKLFKELKGGSTEGVKLSHEEMEKAKDIYYELSGWDVASGTRLYTLGESTDWVYAVAWAPGASVR